MNEPYPTTPMGGMGGGAARKPAMAVVVIVALLVLAGILYLVLGRRAGEPTGAPPGEEGAAGEVSPEAAALEQVTPGNTVQGIERDINETDLGVIDAELEALEQELEGL